MDDILQKIHALAEGLLDGTDIYIVNLKIKPINNIKLFLDADSGLTVEKSAKVNRQLYASLEEAGFFPEGDFSLEVSSPGVDEPLTRRQYTKNTGRTVSVTLTDDMEKTGVLKEVHDDYIVLEVKGAKKKDPAMPVEIPFSNIKKTIVQIIF